MEFSRFWRELQKRILRATHGHQHQGPLLHYYSMKTDYSNIPHLSLSNKKNQQKKGFIRGITEKIPVSVYPGREDKILSLVEHSLLS